MGRKASQGGSGACLASPICMGVLEGVRDEAAEEVERAAVHPFKCDFTTNDFASASSEIIDLK